MTDLSWMAAAVQSVETYEAALETAELPRLLLTALDELLETREANASQLQELVDVLLQMVAFPIDLALPRETVVTLHSARDWAIQTLLDVLTLQPSMSKSLENMQTKFFVSAPCRQSDMQMELHQSLLAAVETEQENETLSDVMEMCASRLEDDEQFLQVTETALLGKTEALTFGSAFLQRLFDRRPMELQVDGQTERRARRGRRLFDALTLESRIRVWANHLLSWQSQLQTWMLEAQRTPFKAISAVLPDDWWLEDASAHVDPAVTAACRRYSHLYVTFIEWCRTHVELLSSSRSMEVVAILSRSTRQENAACLFNRQLLNQVPMMHRSLGSWSSKVRKRAFIMLGSTLEQLQQTRSALDHMWQYEWIGVLERPELLHEVLEFVFREDTGSDGGNKSDEDEVAARGATHFFGWFYSFSSSESAADIATLFTTISSELLVPDIRSGAQWLRRSRADFRVLPLLRLRLVWFWLLKNINIESEISTPLSERRTTSTTTDVLESIEYIFRRFTPPTTKRLFQVELVTQLLAELEWRTQHVNMRTRERFLIGITPLCAWLTKIVRLMQLEEQQKDGRNRSGNHISLVNDVQHLGERLEQFSLK
ncbi:Hypothetical protein PHPALM_20947 [Phytophthora palmivora]|uniref:Uncharacterized protein n=1 Tax=Phytophthora palmivora TaxID=4796 RepID=A0A2P4XDJ7_9STRA|nr:Hypothetical protein PHPALM_20947 [Phytophthora palmivora]